MKLSILYRGPLSSCNYACDYCPFAKHTETASELAVDRAALERFVDWVTRRQDDTISVLFTPWGEALVRLWYQQALIHLTSLPQINRAAIQTNLSAKLDWTEECDRSKLALWCTYHPEEVSRERFLCKCWELIDRNVIFSVGVVGLREHADEIAAIRSELPPSIYVWINAYKRVVNYYDNVMLDMFTHIDPHFPTNHQYHPSAGERCRTGKSVISVDGEGDIRRCHFVRDVLGNIYDEGWEQLLMPRACPNESCGCYIGYAHLEKLGLESIYGEGLLERVPLRMAHDRVSIAKIG